MGNHLPDWGDLPKILRNLRLHALVVAAYVVIPGGSSAWVVLPSAPGATAQEVVAIEAPLRPLPPEAESADVTRFSFIVYGDTRGRRDGEDV